MDGATCHYCHKYVCKCQDKLGFVFGDDAMPWQSIETAPKDYTKFIALINAQEPVVCYWDMYFTTEGSGYTGGDGFVDTFSGEEVYRHEKLTHWMPLPPYPVKEPQ